MSNDNATLEQEMTDQEYATHEATQIYLELERQALVAAAQALVDRWDTPNWKNVPHTGEYINALRMALKDIRKAATHRPSFMQITQL
jgi:hypothetical protein